MYLDAESRAIRLGEELRVLLAMHGDVWPLKQATHLIAAELVQHAANAVVERERLHMRAEINQPALSAGVLEPE